MGKGCLPDSHPLNYGAPGMHGSKYANWALNKSDLIIAVGTRFDDRVTGKVSAFAPGAKVIHFDIDAAEVGQDPPRRRSRSSARSSSRSASSPAR